MKKSHVSGLSEGPNGATAPWPVLHRGGCSSRGLSTGLFPRPGVPTTYKPFLIPFARN